MTIPPVRRSSRVALNKSTRPATPTHDITRANTFPSHTSSTLSSPHAKRTRTRRATIHSAHPPSGASTHAASTVGDGSSHRGKNVFRHDQLRRYAACSACRRRRTKCDAAKPHCGACVRHHNYRKRLKAGAEEDDCGCDYPVEEADGGIENEGTSGRGTGSGLRSRSESAPVSRRTSASKRAETSSVHSEKSRVDIDLLSRRESQASTGDAILTPAYPAEALPSLEVGAVKQEADVSSHEWEPPAGQDIFGDIYFESSFDSPHPPSPQPPIQFTDPFANVDYGSVTSAQAFVGFDAGPPSLATISSQANPTFNSDYAPTVYSNTIAPFQTAPLNPAPQPPPLFRHDTFPPAAAPSTWGTAWAPEVSFPFIPIQQPLEPPPSVRHRHSTSAQYFPLPDAPHFSTSPSTSIPAGQPSWWQGNKSCPAEPQPLPSAYSSSRPLPQANLYPVAVENRYRATPSLGQGMSSAYNRPSVISPQPMLASGAYRGVAAWSSADHRPTPKLGVYSSIHGGGPGDVQRGWQTGARMAEGDHDGASGTGEAHPGWQTGTGTWTAEGGHIGSCGTEQAHSGWQTGTGIGTAENGHVGASGTGEAHPGLAEQMMAAGTAPGPLTPKQLFMMMQMLESRAD